MTEKERKKLVDKTVDAFGVLCWLDYLKICLGQNIYFKILDRYQIGGYFKDDDSLFAVFNVKTMKKLIEEERK